MSGAFYGVYIFNFEDHFATGGAVKWDLFEYDPEHGHVNSVDLDVNGDFLYVADYYNGLQVFDWRESEWLGECYSWLRCNASGVAVSGDWVYLTTTSDYAGILYAIDVHEHDSSMTPYTYFTYSYGAVSPDPCSHIMLMVSGRAYPYAEFMTERIAYTPAEVDAEWVGHTEITPYGPYMFGGWVVVDGDDIYVCGLGHTLTKYHLTVTGGIHSYEWVCSTAQVDEGYSAAIYGDDIIVAGKRGLWRFKKTTLSLVDLDETVQLYGEVSLYGDYAFVMGLDTPEALSDSVRRVIAAYDISGTTIEFKDTMFLDYHDLIPTEACDPAYHDNWYYYGLIEGMATHTSPSGPVIIIQSIVSTRSKNWWNPWHPNAFVPHLGNMEYGDINYHTSIEAFTSFTPMAVSGCWSSGKSVFGHELPKFDIRWNSLLNKDFASLDISWGSATWYCYGTYRSTPEPEYDSIRTHYMVAEWPDWYWAVWDEEGVTNSNRFPLWYCEGDGSGHSSDFTRINAPDIIAGLLPDYDFEELNPIHLTMNGSDELILVTMKNDEYATPPALHYYIDVLHVTHGSYAYGFAKERIEVGTTRPDAISMGINPNPFNASCNICFNIPEKTEVNIEIYNTNGRKVYERNLGELESGQYRKAWNGIDDNGTTVSSGLYLIRLKTSNASIIQKTLLLK